MRVIIVGAGIGGLTAAIALRMVGVDDVHVYEQTSALREVGAGVAISPNAVRVLHHLGLARQLGKVGVVSSSMDTRDWRSGALVARVPLAEAAATRWGAPFYHLHRADLHDALREALGNQHITLGARTVAVEEDASSVTVRFADGRDARGDLLIGADGIHSVVREYIAGPDQAIWSRQISWRGLAPASVGRDIGLEVRHHSFWGPRKQFVCFYVAGERMLNWVGNTQSDNDWEHESWSARGAREDVLALYKDWHPEVRALIEGTEHVFKWALFDRPPLKNWTRGRVSLLGDAAHPMLPYLAQGASQSIEDACMLARCVDQGRENPEHAIEAYAACRQDRTAKIQKAAREMGRAVQSMDPVEVQTRNASLSADPMARFDWIWGYDITSEPIPEHAAG